MSQKDGRVFTKEKNKIPLGEDHLSDLLEGLGPGALVLLLSYLQERGEESSKALEGELISRIERGKGELSDLLGSSSYVNREIVPELIELRDLVDRLLKATGTDKRKRSLMEEIEEGARIIAKIGSFWV